MPLTPQDFVAKWKRVSARERQIAQEHFLDLCGLAGHPTPLEYDPSGTRFAFEMGAAKLGGGSGWADVAKLGFFGWEYKGKDHDLDKAYAQLKGYSDALQNPPLLIVSDINNIIIRANYTNLPTRVITLTLDDLLTAEGLATLRAVFHNPEALKPRVTDPKVTEEAARQFARLAEILRRYGEDPQAVAHFLIRLLFCLFAEDIGLLPKQLFPRLLDQTRRRAKDFAEVLRQLFRAMNTGGYFGGDKIHHFNGGLFNDDSVLELDGEGLDILAKIDSLDWSAIEPSIFGTLFERGLDPAKRSQLGAHYTSRDDIALVVEPVLMAPLLREWERLKSECGMLNAELDGASEKKKAAAAEKIGRKLRAFADEIAAVKVLDPACGSGNFLYVALRRLLDLQNEVINFSAQMGAGRFFISVGPEQLYGLEVNEYAHELAQITIWIGYIQWRLENGYGFTEPILRPMQTIARMDAILAPNHPNPASPKLGEVQPNLGEVARSVGGGEPAWPPVDVIIGNPPFLGGNKIRAELGDEYVNALFKLYEGRVPAFADLVCYWFEKARAMIESGQARRAGLLATNSIRGGVNRKVLERIKQSGDIFWAQSDRDWVLDGAAVRVSMVGFDNGDEKEKSLDGKPITKINADLTAQFDLTTAQILPENKDICFYGSQQKGSFDITAEQAKTLLSIPNPFGLDTRDVVKRSVNGLQILRGGEESWVIDFGVNTPMDKASMYEAPFEYVRKVVYPERKDRGEKLQRDYWWLHARPSPRYREILKSQKRYIASPATAKYRVFVWLDTNMLADHAVVVFAREDDYFMGVLQSKVHVLWSLKLGTSLEDRPRYTPSSSFETFPFPWPPGREPQGDPRVGAIAQAAKELVEMREWWLSPHPTSPKLGEAQLNLGEVAEGQRGSARTLTNLYNQRPTWLDLARKKLDAAVLSAYGWPQDLSDEEILERLLALNLERARR